MEKKWKGIRVSKEYADHIYTLKIKLDKSNAEEVLRSFEDKSVIISPKYLKYLHKLRKELKMESLEDLIKWLIKRADLVT